MGFILVSPDMHMTKQRRPLFPGSFSKLTLGLALSASFAAGGCSPLIKRDLSTIPQGQIGFDDMCGLQDYFDGLEAQVSKEPVIVSSLDLEGGDGVKTLRGGRARLLFEGTFLLKHGKRVLNENWSRLPEKLGEADKFEVEVRWAERAGVRRVVTDEAAELTVAGETVDLPYHVCLSEWLYGAPLYKQRRMMWGLPDPTTGKPSASADATTSPPAAPIDGGADAGGPTQLPPQ
jgi:hypothetical protein